MVFDFGGPAQQAAGRGWILDFQTDGGGEGVVVLPRVVRFVDQSTQRYRFTDRSTQRYRFTER
jgi:hypothetical protein